MIQNNKPFLSNYLEQFDLYLKAGLHMAINSDEDNILV